MDSLAYGCCALATANPSRGRRSSFDAITRRLGWAKTGKLYALSKHSLHGPDFFDSPSCVQVPGTRNRQLRSNDLQLVKRVPQKQGHSEVWCRGGDTERRLGSLDWHWQSKRPRHLRATQRLIRGGGTPLPSQQTSVPVPSRERQRSTRCQPPRRQPRPVLCACLNGAGVEDSISRCSAAQPQGRICLPPKYHVGAVLVRSCMLCDAVQLWSRWSLW